MNNDILKEIEKARKTGRLYLQNEEITEEIWSEIIKLENLKSLALSSVKISNYIGLKNLKKLEDLYINKNNLLNLPQEILLLKNLESLDISDNQISYIPPKLFESKNFNTINLRDNPIEVLEFTYNMQKEENNYNSNEKKREELFNLLELEYKIIYNNKESFFIKTEENYAFIELEAMAYFTIKIFGKKETQKNMLSKIRKPIEKWIKENNIEVNSSFSYPTKDELNQYTSINYEKLIENRKANEYSYFDSYFSEKIPVSDLLNYIGEDNIKIDNRWNGTDSITKIKIKNLKIFSEIEVTIQVVSLFDKNRKKV